MNLFQTVFIRWTIHKVGDLQKKGPLTKCKSGEVNVSAEFLHSDYRQVTPEINTEEGLIC